MKKSILDNVLNYLDSLKNHTLINREIITLSKKIENFCFTCNEDLYLSNTLSYSCKPFSLKDCSINKTVDEEDSFIKNSDFNVASFVDHDILNKYLYLSDYLENSYDKKKAVAYLNNIVTSKNLTNANIINNSFIDGGLLSRILNGKSDVTKDSAIKLCFGLGLNYDESINLLLRFGYTLSALNKRDCIIKYGIDNNLAIDEIDYILEELDEKALIRK